MIEIKPATRDLLTAHYGRLPSKTSTSIVAVDGDRVVGVAGFYVEDNRVVLFSELTDEIRARPKLIIKGYRMLWPRVRALGMPVHALANRCIDGADRMLMHFGFEHVALGVYECRI